MSITKKYLINGPNNVVRLTDGNKILYIFGDYHLESHEQTQCKLDTTYPSVDIDVFLFEFIKNNKEKKFDLFIELISGHYKLKQTIDKTIDRDGYLSKVLNLFTDNLISNKREIKINPKYPNFRFHNMDMRNTLLFNNLIEFDYNIHNSNDIDYFLFKLMELEKLITISCEYNHKNNKEINKILMKYSNDVIKKKINDLYHKLYFNNYKQLLKLIEDTKKMLLKTKILTINIINKFYNSWYKIKGDYQLLNGLLTDLYFIRRFLDKNYIKNSILYTGQLHLVDISYLLVKYFNFKITNVYYNPKKIDLNKQFLKNNYTFKYIKNILNIIENKTNNKTYQCINLFDFPDNFN